MMILILDSLGHDIEVFEESLKEIQLNPCDQVSEDFLREYKLNMMARDEEFLRLH